MTIPVFLIIFAESDAKKRDPLLNTAIRGSPIEALAERGVEAEGLEVVSVAEAEEREAALDCFVKIKKRHTKRKLMDAIFLKLKQKNKFIRAIPLFLLETENKSSVKK